MDVESSEKPQGLRARLAQKTEGPSAAESVSAPAPIEERIAAAVSAQMRAEVLPLLEQIIRERPAPSAPAAAALDAQEAMNQTAKTIAVGLRDLNAGLHQTQRVTAKWRLVRATVLVAAFLGGMVSGILLLLILQSNASRPTSASSRSEIISTLDEIDRSQR